jgi:hypothetical protein
MVSHDVVGSYDRKIPLKKTFVTKSENRLLSIISTSCKLGDGKYAVGYVIVSNVLFNDIISAADIVWI